MQSWRFFRPAFCLSLGTSMHGHITTKEQYTVARTNESAPATPLVEGMIVEAKDLVSSRSLSADGEFRL
jgi:hypothetical protein